LGYIGGWGTRSGAGSLEARELPDLIADSTSTR
jgi:hypothetical protein